jgi:acetyltransferase-like isoleucine patch superfamily enzyme
VIGVAASSVLCTASLRARRVKCAFVTCEGRLPLIHAAGSVRLGRIALRCRIAPVELGAEPGGALSIADRTFINQGASLVASHLIEVGPDVRIGDFAAVYDSDRHPVDQLTPTTVAPVRIEHNAWLGRGAIVLPGSVIGAHAVVAAGAVVRGTVPARTLVAGNPARAVRVLSADEDWRRP